MDKDNKPYKFYTIIFMIITIVMTMSMLIVLFLFIKEKNKTITANNKNEANKTQEINEEDLEDKNIKETIKDLMENGTGTMSMLRQLYPENVVVYDSNKYLFLPVYEEVEKNDIKNENIIEKEMGELEYINNGKTVSHKGIDVSKYQGEIDWSKVASDGVEFAILRVGYRGYGTGAIMLDEAFEKNIQEATNVGIKVGVYFFSQAITTEEAIEEARFVKEKVKEFNINYPIVFDTEDIPNEEARTEGLTVEERTNIAVAFCEEVKKDGFTPMIYANLRWFTMALDISKLNDYEKWYAYYDKEMYFPYKISMWQYSENGTVNGINGKVDMNISFKEW